MERKVCFITGSGSGNGRSMAIRFAELGYDICLHHSGRDPEGAEKTRKLIVSKGVDCKVLEENLSKPGAAHRLFEKFRAEYDRLDIFINNSGITVGGPIMKMDEATFNRVAGVNYKACYFCVSEAGKFMREKGIRGSITMIASNHHRVNFPGGFSLYASLKSAMARFTRWAALEYSPYGIRVNCIAPGYILPIYEKGVLPFDEEAYVKHVSPRIPMKRMVPPAELADLALFLAGNGGQSITGQTIDVDGGDSLLYTSLDHYRLDGKRRKKKKFAGMMKKLGLAKKEKAVVEDIAAEYTGRKVCFITGSGSGNGRGMAIRMAELGYDICLHHSGRDPVIAAETKALVEAKGAKCKVLVEDLTQSGAAHRLFEKFRAEYDRLDVYINNSGKTRQVRVMEADEETFDFVFDLNFRATYFCVAEAGKFMREKGIRGAVVMIASNHHEVNFPGRFSMYASAKAAMVRFTKWAALEFSHYGIRVNCIAPGYINPGYDKNERYLSAVERVTPTLPLKRFAPSAEMAELVHFLAGPSGRSIIGQTINVDGGDSLLNAPLDAYHLTDE